AELERTAKSLDTRSRSHMADPEVFGTAAIPVSFLRDFDRAAKASGMPHYDPELSEPESAFFLPLLVRADIVKPGTFDWIRRFQMERTHARASLREMCAEGASPLARELSAGPGK